MLRFFLLSGLLTVASSGVGAQNVPAPPVLVGPPFAGRIFDQATRQPIIGAVVQFPDLRQGAATDPEGRFSFSRLPRGRFLLQVRALGYGTVVQTVNTGSPEGLEIGLSPAATEIGQVVVTGVSASTEMRRSPVPVTSIDRAHLDQAAGTNAIDLIARVPGVAQITTGQAVSKPVIRGMGFNRVVTLNNGAKQEGQQWGDEHGIEIDENSFDRVEIIKGPGSLLYGSDAMAGVINFLPPDPVAEGRIIGLASAEYQTNAHLQGYSVMNAGNRGGIVWLARGSAKLAGSYRNRYDGRVFNSAFREYDANGFVGINRTWGYSHLTINSFNQELAMPEGERDSATGRFLRQIGSGEDLTQRPVTDDELRGYRLYSPRQVVNHLRVGLDNNFIIGQARLTANVGWQLNQRQEYEPLLGDAKPSLRMLLNTLDYAVRLYLPERNGWQPTVGVSGLVQANENLGKEALIPNYELFDGGVFGLLKRSFGKLDLSGGARYDVRYVSATNEPDEDAEEEGLDPAALANFAAFDRTFQNVTGSAGAALNLTEQLTLKANVSRGFRAPNIAELGSYGQHEGTLRFEIGSTDLKPETSLQFDAGVSLMTDHVNLRVDAFNNTIQNYIFTRLLLNAAGTGDSISGEGTREYVYTQGQARLHGGEVSLDLHPHPLDWLHFENSFSMVRAEQQNVPTAQRWLPFIPGDRFQSEVRTQFPKAGPHLGNVYARFNVEHTFAQNRYYAAYHTETATPAYTLVNAGVGTDVVNAQRRTVFSVHLAANNLFDAAYQSHLNRLKYAARNNVTGRTGLFNPGRNVSIKLVVPLGWGG